MSIAGCKKLMRSFSDTVAVIAVAVLVFVMSGCGIPSYDHRLVEADSMLRRESLDSAGRTLSGLSPVSMGASDYAYYNLLKSALQFKEEESPLNDSILIGSRDYFRSCGDRDKEGLCQFYLGMSAFSEGNLDKAALLLKEAEALMPSIKDAYVKMRIWSGLVAVNYYAANDSTAYRYAYRELALSRRENNPTWITFAFNHLSCLYAKAGRNDSAYHYISMIEPMMKDVPEYARSLNLGNIAIYYLATGDTARATDYAEKSYATRQAADNGNFLAKLMVMKGDTAAAMSIWRKILPDASAEGRVGIMESMARMYYDYGDSHQAMALNLRIGEMRDSLQRTQTAMRVQALQLDYDHKESMRKARYRMILVIVLLGAILIVGLIFSLRHLRGRRIRREAVSAYRDRVYLLEQRSEDMKRRLSELRGELARQDTMHSKEMARLRKEISAHEKERSARLAKGKKLLDEVKAEHSVGRWTKEDFNCFFEYYDIIDPEFRVEAEEKYSGLSYGNRLLLIIERLGMDSKQICTVMGISPGSLRSARSRLKAKLIGG